MRNYQPGNGTPIGIWLVLFPVALVVVAIFAINHAWPIVVVVGVGSFVGYRIPENPMNRTPGKLAIWMLASMAFVYGGLELAARGAGTTIPLIVECGSYEYGALMSDNCREHFHGDPHR